jgi:integrase
MSIPNNGARRGAGAKREFPYVDRVRINGTVYLYYRHARGARTALPGPFGSPAFKDAWAIEHARRLTLAETKDRTAPVAPAGPTFRALIQSYTQHHEASQNLKDRSRKAYDGAYKKILAEFGDLTVAGATTTDLRAFLSTMAKTPAAANRVLSRLRTLYRYAQELPEFNVTRDPTAPINGFKTGTHHTWTEPEIELYRARWPLGTIERRALELFLGTGQRIGDVAALTWSDYQGGVFFITPQKTDALPEPTELEIPPTEELRVILEREERYGEYVLARPDGSRFTTSSLDHLMRTAAAAAGLRGEERKKKKKLCTPHGLRKAQCRRLAEVGCTAPEIQAITGHRSLKEVERYIKAADRKPMARSAIGKINRRYAIQPNDLDVAA